MLARLRVTQRRLSLMKTDAAQESSIFTNGALKIDYAAGCAYLGGAELHLTPIEYKLLCLLSKNVGKVLTHTYITQQIWGSSWENDIASLRVFMATLRKKLERGKDGQQYIQTHIGIGIEGLNIAWYGIIITFGMILGFMLALRRCKKTGVEPDHLYNLVLWLIPVCILCARAYYVLFEWEQYKDNLLSVFQINKGGLAIYGGILGGVAVVLIYCKVKKLSFWSLADTLIPSLVLGQAIGRWGNFVNQEAYGNLITNPDLQFFPYGVYIEELGQWHQATFFYESALNTLLLIAMLISYPHFRKKGYLLPFYMIGYGVIRCFVEGLRTDSLYLMPGVRVSQVLSGCLVLLGVLLVGIIRRRQDIQA